MVGQHNDDGSEHNAHCIAVFSLDKLCSEIQCKKYVWYKCMVKKGAQQRRTDGGERGNWNWGVPAWFGHDYQLSIFYAILIAVLVEIENVTLFLLSVFNKQTTLYIEFYAIDLNLLPIKKKSSPIIILNICMQLTW
jgi:hypothetical protein